MSETVIILPESHDAILCLRLTGMVAADDFTKNFGDRVYQMVADYGQYNLYVFYDENFEGWSREAADLSFKCISQCGTKARRLAYVNAPESRILMMKMLRPLMNAETQYFNLADRDQALQWVLSVSDKA